MSKVKLAKVQAKQQRYREDPAYLARAIAKNIRRDDKVGLSATDFSGNGRVHWYQETWGEIRRRNLDGKVRNGADATYFKATCTTTACVAGSAVSLAGYSMLIPTWDVWDDADPDDVYNSDYCQLLDGSVSRIRDAAVELLHLSSAQARYLFYAQRTKDEVLAVLDKIGKGKEWQVPEWDDPGY